jgi:hypothetical protein
VDVSKAIRDLGHKDTYGLEEGMQITAEWMRQVCKFRADMMTSAEPVSSAV